jgi:hypothetical protein
LPPIAWRGRWPKHRNRVHPFWLVAFITFDAFPLADSQASNESCSPWPGLLSPQCGSLQAPAAQLINCIGVVQCQLHVGLQLLSRNSTPLSAPMLFWHDISCTWHLVFLVQSVNHLLEPADQLFKLGPCHLQCGTLWHLLYHSFLQSECIQIKLSIVISHIYLADVIAGEAKCLCCIGSCVFVCASKLFHNGLLPGLLSCRLLASASFFFVMLCYMPVFQMVG